MLICDKRRPRTRGDTNIRPPQGGRIKTAPPASGPRLGRSLAWGGTPPGPPGLRPLVRLRAPGPCCLGHPAGVVPGTGAPGGRGGQRAALSTPDAQPLPSPQGDFSKEAPQGRASGEGSGGACPPRQGGGGQPGPGGGRPGCSRRLCPPSTDWARLSTGDRVQGGAVVQNNLIGQTFLVLHNQPAQSRASIGFQENHCIKK